jgi:arylsulfatase
MASGTPYRLYKINTHAGGHSVPMVLAGPGVPNGVRRQFAHVTDVLPTLLDLVGVERPTHRYGVELQPVAGASFRPTIEDADAASTHPEQHYEMVGNRGYYRDGWEVVTDHRPLTPITEAEWELYDLRADPTETTNLAAEHPERVAELAAAWEAAAQANQVYPLDEGSGVKFLQRPPRSAVYGEAVTLLPGTPTLERWRSQQLVANRSFTVTVRLRSVGEGVLVAHGDQGGGYSLAVQDGTLVFHHNDGRGMLRTLSGRAGLVCEARFTAPGRGGWSVSLVVDGVEVDSGDSFTVLFPMAPFQGIDVGIDRKSPVVWGRGPSPYTGEIESVTYTPGDLAPDSPVALLDVLRDLGRRFE